MRVISAVLFVGLVSAGCSDPLGSGPGALRIDLAVTGVDGDPDGYTFTVDGRHPTVLQGPGSTTLSLGPGRHTVALGQLTANCSATSPEAQEAVVSPSDTALVAFAVECRAATGILEVTAATTGFDVDPDGYFVSLDGGTARGLWRGGLVRYAGVPAGLHSVSLTGLAPNCTVSGPNPRTDVQMTVGGLVRDTARVSFDVVCADTTGAVRVITSTTGSSLDPDGFLVTVAPGLVVPQRVLLNDTIVVGRIRAGAVSVGLGDIALNCLSTTQNPKSVPVTRGDTTDVRFDVSCASPGTVRVTAPTTGQDPDSSYLLVVDGGTPIPLASGGQVSLDLAPGNRSLELKDIARNCAVNGSNPVVVNVTAGVTTDVTFDVTCTPLPRTGVDIIITTTGTNIDTGYFLTICDYYCYYWGYSYYWQGAVQSNDLRQVDLPAGYYYFTLTDVAGNCMGPTTGSFIVQQDQITTVQLDFTCGALTTVRLVATTTGQIPTTSYWVQVDNGSFTIPLAPNGSALFDLISGSHTFTLNGLPLGCIVSGSNPLTVTLPPGTVTDVAFSVNCTPPGTLSVSASTGGSDLDPYYGVLVDGTWVGSLQNSSTASVQLAAGSHSVLLTDVASNCTVTSPNPAAVTVPSGGTASLVFAVFCDPNPVLRVTVSTTGSNVPVSFRVGVDYDYYYGFVYSTGIGSNGVASLKVPPGDHLVSLYQVPLNCNVTSPNNFMVTVPSGTTKDVAFTVVCQ